MYLPAGLEINYNSDFSKNLLSGSSILTLKVTSVFSLF